LLHHSDVPAEEIPVKHTLALLGDINLMNVTDASVPFRRVREDLASADCRFANLECSLYDRPSQHELRDEGFYAPPAIGEALKILGMDAIGNANNVNFGSEPITSSCATLKRLGIPPNTGAGVNAQRVRAGGGRAQGIRFGFLQRTSVYWPVNHEAGESSPGVAILQGHTAYEPNLYKTNPAVPPANRPGVPPAIITWADRKSLAAYREDVAKLRAQCDILTVSHHWGLREEVLEYMIEIAHAAMIPERTRGHRPRSALFLPMEMYKASRCFTGSATSLPCGIWPQARRLDREAVRSRLSYEDKAHALSRKPCANEANETFSPTRAMSGDRTATIVSATSSGRSSRRATSW
jgi:poly-gamma-glutamate synthesis protein (capsule biosynthesis protein)